MINTSQLFSSKIAESTRQFSARLMYGTEEISGAIRSVQTTSGACGEGNFTVGAVFSSYIEVVIDECEDVLEDKELLLQIGLLVDDGTIEYVDIGHYTVTSPKTSAYSTTFTAVGRITSKLNVLFDVPEVLTLRNIANAITAETGVSIIFNGEVSDAVLAKDIRGMTCKEALSVIAGTFGGFATEDNSGNIVVSKYNKASKVSVDGDRMTELPEFNDYDYELYGVKVVVSAAGEDEDGNTIEEVAFTEGTPRITINNEFMTADLFESFVVNTVGYAYRPGTVPLALGDPRLQPWDCLEVTDVKGSVHIVPCLNIVHTFDGGLTTTITAPGESESESSSSVAGPMAQQIERLNYELITAQEAIIKRIKVDDLKAEVAKLGYASVEELEAFNATIEGLNAKDAEITGKLTAYDADIKNLKAKDVELTGQLTAVDADIKNLKAKDVEITGTLTTATADITNLKAKDAEIEGTLTATNAEITSLKAKNVEIDGQLTVVSANINELEAKDAEIESLVAKKADIKDLEAATADIEELVAKDAAIEALVAKKIDAETVEADYLKTEDLEAEVAEFGYLKADNLEAEVGEFGYLKADDLAAEVAEFGYAKAKDLEATNLTVSNLSGDVASFKKATADNFTATNANISKVSGDLADYKTVVAGQFSARDADIESLQAEDARIEGLFAGYATVGDLNATNADIEVLVADQADFEEATAQNFSAVNASIDKIEADYVTTAELEAESAEIQELFAGYATVDNLKATNANVTSLTTKQANFENATADNFTAVNADINNIKADYVKTTELDAESADIRALFADYATLTQLNATNGNIASLSSTVATINSAYMDEAEVNTLVAGKGFLTEAQVNTLVAGKGYFTEAQVDDLVVGKGYITTAQTNTLLSNYVKTSTLTADYIKATDIALTYATIENLNSTNAAIDNLDATYATIDLANVEDGSITQAMIGTGVVGTAQIADGSITDAKIVGLTANKITAGRLDAGVIEVVNLNAANITVGTINGQQIASGAIDTTKLTSSLSSTISTASSNASQALTDAADAQDTADSALSKANTAQTTADGKTTVFYQTSAPSTSGRKTNDIWFDTDDGNKMYYWNGSAWTVRQFGTNAIANAAITNALIADATIQNAKIANLDAGKISTGTLSADRIGASSIVAAKIASGAVTAGKIAADAVTTDKIASGAVVADSIAADAITADKIVTNAVTADKIAANAVTANKILAGAITTEKIAASAVTASKLSVDTLSAITANLGTVTAGIIQSENFAMSDYSVDEDGNVTGTVKSGLKIDLNNRAYYTPHITMKDNYINLNGYMTVGTRTNGDSGAYSFTQGYSNSASGLGAHAEGGSSQADGIYSHAEGSDTFAYGGISHAEGLGTYAEGDYSHTEGYLTQSWGRGAHAEGSGTHAEDDFSHAEGVYTIASGVGAHAEGNHTQANSQYQHVQGKYNISDPSDVYAHIVGNGTSDTARSNAHTLDWDGNAWYAGNITAAGSIYEGGTLLSSKYAPISHTHPSATTSAAGFMSTTDKAKLNATNDGYGTCSTAAATAAKVITISGNTNWVLAAGSKITVLFSSTNTAESPTFNVNGTGAKKVYYGASQITTSNLSYAGYKDRPMNFVYDGTQYRFIGWGYESGNTNTYLRVYRQTSGYDGNYPLLVGRTKATSMGTVGSNGTYAATYGVFREVSGGDATLTANPAKGSITATTFIGALDGNAATATKATQDGDGNVITSTYALVGHTHSGYASAGHTHSEYALASHTHSEYAAASHTHDYLPLAGGTLTGELIFKAASSQPNTKGIKWGAFNSKNPYIGYCTSSSDGTFMVGSLAGTTYTTGLSIGGSSGNLLWKGSKVAVVSDIPAAYTHPSYTAKSSGLYKVTVDATGHVSATTAVAKSDITALGIPSSDTNTTYTFATGDSNGQIKVTPSGGSAQNISVKGLGSAAYTASTAYATAAQGTLATNAMPKAGGTFTGDVTHSSGTYFNASTYMKNNVGYNAYGSDGTAAILMCLTSSDELVIGSSAYPHAGGTTIQSPNGGVTLKSPNSIIQLDGKYSSVALNSYTSDNYQGGWCPITDDDGIIALGQSNRRWYKVYATTTSIGTSDRREKSDIVPLGSHYSKNGTGNLFEQLFDKLVPTTYKLNIEKTDDMHIGFIAQDIVKSMEELGLTEDMLGIIDHEYWTDEKTGEERDRYGLAYTEFIALNTYMIQKQKAKIETLQEQLSHAMIELAKQQKEIDSLRQVI